MLMQRQPACLGAGDKRGRWRGEISDTVPGEACVADPGPPIRSTETEAVLRPLSANSPGPGLPDPWTLGSA